MATLLKKFVVLDLPILHKGYLNFLNTYATKSAGVFILGGQLIHKFTHLEKEIRAVKPEVMKKILTESFNLPKIEILSSSNIKKLKGSEIILSNDSISRRFASQYLKRNKVKFVSAFLRWDESHVVSKKIVKYDVESKKPFDRKIMKLAIETGKMSPDWWRQVGAILVHRNKVIMKEYNRPLPHEQLSYTFGDIRDFIEAGKQPEISSAIHSEQAIIAQAAQRGIPLKGRDLYVTVFPCPVCAKLIAYSGIARCYFYTGHVSFDGERVMKASNVKIIRVKV